MTDFPGSENPHKIPVVHSGERGPHNTVIVIGGPTASGKSGLAMALAERFDGVIINADSMQVYEDLRIITARPSVADEARAPHRLFGILPASERCSVGRWLDLAEAEIEVAWHKGKVPLLVGGTGMYLKTVTEGLAPVPTVSDDFVAKAEILYDSLGGEAFLVELAELDSQAANRLPPGDRQRLVRAYSVVKATGHPLDYWHSQSSSKPRLNANFIVLSMMPERQALYATCDSRFEQMLVEGALGEVKEFAEQSLSSTLPAMRALGVPELLSHLRDEISLQQATQKTQQATRNFAKRQLTWFRNQVTPDLLLENTGFAAIQDAITFLLAAGLVRDR